LSSVAVHSENAGQTPRTPPGALWRSAWLLLAGIAILAVPTLVTLAQQLWSTEDGAHGPIVLATGLWLLYQSRNTINSVARPGNASIATAAFIISLIGYVMSRMTSMLGVECLALYAALLAVFYYHAGAAAMRKLWFPFIYLLFMMPMPETLILPLTHFLKLELSTIAVSLLSMLGFQVGQGGVIIYIDQYELLVEDACSGVNSLIGLSSIGIFYAYVHYHGKWRDSLPLLLGIAPIAVLSNFVRLLVMILVTHYYGDRVAQKYVHDVAAIILFSVAMGLFVCWDMLIQWARQGRAKS